MEPSFNSRPIDVPTAHANENNRAVSTVRSIGGLEIEPPAWVATPVTFWDVFGEQGHPVRATVSDMGPLLLARLLNLNETQAGVLTLVFKIADDNGLLLLDLKDLRAMLQFVGEHGREFTTGYGNISVASVGAIQRFTVASPGPLLPAEKTIGVPWRSISSWRKAAWKLSWSTMTSRPP